MMAGLQKIGALAALTNAATALATLFVAFGLIGWPAIADNQKLFELAVQNPIPFIIQDILKCVSAVCTMVLVMTMFWLLKSIAPKLMTAAVFLGVLGILCLLANAGLSLFLVLAAGKTVSLDARTIRQLNLALIVLGMAVIFFNGWWYLITNRTGLKYRGLPKTLCYLGLTIGLLSLFPPLGILALALSVGWLLWLAKTFLENDSKI